MKGLTVTLLGLVSLAAAAAAEPAMQQNVNTILARKDTTIIGQKIEVPKNPTVIFSTSTFAPGARTPVHKHLYPHYVCIEAGTLTIVGTETGKDYPMSAGSCFLEMLDKWHYGINKGTVPVKTMVVDQVPAGVTVNRVLEGERQ